ncbi:MAG: copper-binding protein [Pseudomonadaceae bacterium]|nr:copper binding periplasmic protein CusF [Stutzerimonas degradans]MCF6751212.1 copper-binding protein [Stutzerimonas stutzeri]MCQ4268948.1 copper-binding protein [Stutzerimonas degradans]
MNHLVATLAALCLMQPALAEDLLKPETVPPPIDDRAASASLEAEVTHHASGTLRAIYATQGSVTIALGPVVELKWPAMVMPFRIDAQQLEGLAVGDAVEFEFTNGEMDPRIVTIRKR